MTITSGGMSSMAPSSNNMTSSIAHNDLPPKGANVYPASRRRSNKRMGLKGHHGNYIMAYKRLSTSLGSKKVEQHLLLGSGGNKI